MSEVGWTRIVTLTHMHACMHTHTQTHTHAYTHAHTHTHKHMHTHACAHTHTHTHTHTYTCMDTITVECECIGKVREIVRTNALIISSHFKPPYFDTTECILDSRHHIMHVIIQRQVSSGLQVHL